MPVQREPLSALLHSTLPTSCSTRAPEEATEIRTRTPTTEFSADRRCRTELWDLQQDLLGPLWLTMLLEIHVEDEIISC